MTIDQSQQSALSFLCAKPSHRTRPEQFVGLGIYLIISLGFALISSLATEFSLILGSLYFLCISFSMWSLWRLYSLRLLKLELSLFLAQFLFLMAWSVSFFILHEMLLALVALLLLWCNTLVATLLFWKKERLSGGLLIFPLFWIFYLVGLNMVKCISNP